MHDGLAGGEEVDDVGGVTRLKACARVVVAVSIARLHEALLAVLALESFFLSVRLLMVDHVAELGHLDVAVKARKKLVRAARLLLDHVVLHEAEVLRVVTVPISHTLLYGFATDTGNLATSWDIRGIGIVASAFSQSQWPRELVTHAL